MLTAFSVKRKRTTNAQMQKVKLSTPLLKNDIWKIIDSFLLPRNENKFNQIHKCFTPFSTKFENVTKRIYERFNHTGWSWLFFEHFETRKIFVQNVNDRDLFEETALHCAVGWNDAEIAKAVIEAGVDINARDEDGESALHFAADSNRLEIGKILVDAGADLTLQSDYFLETALQIADRFNYRAFAKMLCKKMKN